MIFIFVFLPNSISCLRFIFVMHPFPQSSKFEESSSPTKSPQCSSFDSKSYVTESWRDPPILKSPWTFCESALAAYSEIILESLWKNDDFGRWCCCKILATKSYGDRFELLSVTNISAIFKFYHQHQCNHYFTWMRILFSKSILLTPFPTQLQFP